MKLRSNFLETLISWKNKNKNFFLILHRVNHDVKLKSPFESSVKGFHGNQGYTRPKPKKFTTKTNLVTPPSTFPDYEIYDEDDDDNQNNYQILQDGYKGIGSLSHPGLHDDRPPFVKFNHQNSPKHNIAEASFGGLKFNLPASGKLPDRPMREEKDDTSSMLRDLPNLDLDLHTSAGSNKKESHNYAKSYLRNPFGADFIRLEVDADRYLYTPSWIHFTRFFYPSIQFHKFFNWKVQTQQN